MFSPEKCILLGCELFCVFLWGLGYFQNRFFCDFGDIGLTAKVETATLSNNTMNQKPSLLSDIDFFYISHYSWITFLQHTPQLKLNNKVKVHNEIIFWGYAKSSNVLWLCLIRLVLSLRSLQSVSISRRCHNHTLQTNPRLCEEEATNDNRNTTIKIPQKESNQLSLHQRDDCETIKDTKYCITMT